MSLDIFGALTGLFVIVYDGSHALRYTLGRARAVVGPGIHFKVPLLQTFKVEQTKHTTLDLEPQVIQLDDNLVYATLRRRPWRSATKSTTSSFKFILTIALGFFYAAASVVRSPTSLLWLVRQEQRRRRQRGTVGGCLVPSSPNTMDLEL